MSRTHADLPPKSVPTGYRVACKEPWEHLSGPDKGQLVHEPRKVVETSWVRSNANGEPQYLRCDECGAFLPPEEAGR